MLLPGFHEETFPFLVDYGTFTSLFSKFFKKQSDSFDLVNIKSGKRQPLIFGSAQNDSYGR